MTREDTIRMAREAGLRRFGPLNIDRELECFAELVAARAAAAERAECLAVSDERANGENDAQWISDRIRARGGTPSLTCAKCGVDRMHEACKQPGPTCPFMGEAQ